MKILFLGPASSCVYAFLKEKEETVLQTEENLHHCGLDLSEINFTVSYGYRHILKKGFILSLPRLSCINLHISLLPWNKGADPNFWSFYEDTPKGVTIHLIDEGVDTGDILVQKEVLIKDDHTLSSSYNLLQSEIQNLFFENWQALKNRDLTPKKQIGIGTLHYKKDLEVIRKEFPEGWETPTQRVAELGKISRQKRPFLI